MSKTEELHVSEKHFMPFFFLLVQSGDGQVFIFLFAVFSFPFNSEQPVVLRWHWFEHEVVVDDL